MQTYTFLHRIVCSCLLFLFALHNHVMRAQENKKDYEGPGVWFASMSVGTSLAYNENVHSTDIFKTKLPSGDICLGRLFTPRWGAQLNMGISAQIGYPPTLAITYLSSLYKPYEFYSATATADVLLNLTNYFRRYDSRNWFDGYVIAGGGILYRFFTESFVKNWYEDVYAIQSDAKAFWLSHIDLVGAFHSTRYLDLKITVGVNCTDNAYNGRVDHSRPDFFLSLKAGVIYYFANSRKRHRFANPPIEHKYWRNLNY